MINNRPTDDELIEMRRLIYQLAKQANLGNSSVSRGSTEFRGNESLKVIGSAIISGWLIITGTLKLVGNLVMEGVLTASGTTNLNGPVNIAGYTTVTGNSDFNGIVNIDGPLGVNGLAYLRGNTELTGNLDVLGGGRIATDTVTLDGEGIKAPLILNILTPMALFSESVAINDNLTANGDTQLGGIVKMTALQTKVGATANVHIDSAGRLWKVG